MKLGIEMFATEYATRPDDLARECEARGFESVWFPEHTHIPTSRRTPFPGGGELPKEYSHTHDLFVALMAAAGATKTIKLGSGICLAMERDPITMAKEVASVDLLSNGRLIFGIGGGWNAEEMANHGTPFKKRWKILRERIEAMKLIWTKDEAEYHGEFVNFDPIWCYPKPAQKPYPPILLGSNTDQGLGRVVQYCNGWLPNARYFQKIPGMVKELRSRAAQAGRRTEDFPISILGAQGNEAMLQQCRDMGAERAIFFVPPAPRETVLPLLDQYAAFIPKVA
ncbi:MAG: LLM class F420-dependent oxidoreductase [Deltaproteobacteria bacterium]|nr:LLM class F420-dependent oxidoreductase [Deltaproteobacteria bacterium]